MSRSKKAPTYPQFSELFDIQLITKLRVNLKNQLTSVADRILLRRRAIIEIVIDQLKNISQIEHSRHRSATNFFVNVLCGLIAYCCQPIKPSLVLNTLVALPDQSEFRLI
jgi:hypothetical protein